jgi:tRNA A37 methylthiotransferase MiaB
MKKVSFVQPNFNWGPVNLDIYFIPYSAGLLWAYANQFEEIQQNYYFGEFVWRRDKISDVVESLKDCSVVGFSTYIWNRKYNYALAEELKKANPDCLLVFGGPEVPVSKDNIFELHPYIDVVILQEGEHSFYEVLKGNLESPGMIVNKNGVRVDTGVSKRFNDLSTIPSPYLAGVFDHLIEQHPDVLFNGTLESNRGCPYQCTFCDWGSLTYSKVKKYNLEQVFAEIEWFADNKIDHITLTDANYGIFPDRDMLIAEKLAEQRRLKGYPRLFNTNWAKNQKQSVVDIISTLIDGGFNAGLTLSLQSSTQEVLKAIKRTNLEINKVKEVFALCDKRNIPCYTELILGLPGETLDTWTDNFYDLYEAGNHTGINVYQCQLIENAEMNIIQRKEYDMQSMQVKDYFEGGSNDYFDEIQEDNAIVVSTRDLPPEDMIKAYMVAWFHKTFHIGGFTNYIARFMHKFADENYKSFYSKFQTYIMQDQYMIDEYKRVAKSVRQWYTTGDIDEQLVGGIPVMGENMVISTIWKLHIDNKIDYIYEKIADFMNQEYDLLFSDQLVDFQKNCVLVHEKLEQYPIQYQHDYNFYGYIVNNDPLDQSNITIYENRDENIVTKDIFVQQIYYQRRSDYGKAKVKVETLQ